MIKLDINKLDKEAILEDRIFQDLLSETDDIKRERKRLLLLDRASELGVKTAFSDLYRTYLKVEKAKLEEEKTNLISLERNAPNTNLERVTDFNNAEEYPQLKSGNWIADQNGVRTYGMFGEVLACYCPILPVCILKNLETKTVKVTLAFYKYGKWEEVTIDKSIAASNTKIVQLADHGVPVTTETAKNLVRYLADVENLNEHKIPVKVSTSKMGWFGKDFMPYDQSIIFDGNGRFGDLYDSLQAKGSYERWLDIVKKIRKSKRTEPKFFMSASFASVLISLCNVQPFICNLWGETEGGKTVTSMIATSIWANPSEGKYITDFKSTDVSLEVRLDFLNHLPLIIDDSATEKDKFSFDMSKFAYDICKGKGKGRSNRSLGIAKENTWRNVTLTNGEHPISNENLQGGAMNRVLDYKVGKEAIYEKPAELCDIIRANYGHAGIEFIKAIREIGVEKIKEIRKGYFDSLSSMQNMAKQCNSLSLILTADRVATEFIFKDNEYIDVSELKSVLVERERLSENRRCYEYIMSEITANGNHFSLANDKVEFWGEIDDKDGYVIIINSVFERICRSGGYSSKAFLTWAKDNGMLKTAGDRLTKQKKFNGKGCWCVFLKLDEAEKHYEEPEY